MPTVYQPGGVQRVQIQRVDPDNSLSTIFKGLGAGVQQGYGMKADQNAAEAKRLGNAQDILAGTPPPGLPGGGLSTTMTMPQGSTLPAAQPVNIGAPSPLDRALIAANTVPERMAAEDIYGGNGAAAHNSPYDTAANSAWQINDPNNITNLMLKYGL